MPANMMQVVAFLVISYSDDLLYVAKDTYLYINSYTFAVVIINVFLYRIFPN